MLKEPINLYDRFVAMAPINLTLAAISHGDEKKRILIYINKKIETLPQKYSNLWDFFKAIKNKTDIEAFEQFLADQIVRDEYYKLLSTYSKTLGIALGNLKFAEEIQANEIEARAINIAKKRRA
jgi:hypothetical protein